MTREAAKARAEALGLATLGGSRGMASLRRERFSWGSGQRSTSTELVGSRRLVGRPVLKLVNDVMTLLSATDCGELVEGLDYTRFTSHHLCPCTTRMDRSGPATDHRRPPLTSWGAHSSLDSLA